MDGIRRTVPRSARRTTPRRSAQEAFATPKFSSPSPFQVKSERYIPDFQGHDAKAKEEPQTLPQIRTGVEVLSPPETQPTIAASSAPQISVRWLPVSGRVAVAAVGSGDGAPGADVISLYAVAMEETGLSTSLVRELPHEGKALRMATCPSDGILYTGSSDGTLRSLDAAGWADESQTLVDVAKLPRHGSRRESIAGVAPVAGGKVVAFGGSGTMTIADVGGKGGIILQLPQCDAVGFTDAAAVDPDGGHELVSAGGSGEVCVWDTRTVAMTSRCESELRHPLPGVVTSCIMADAAQAHFVIGGTRTGEICVWDRRGTDSYPVNRVSMHEGPVWEARVVSSSKPGLLLSGGEDGKVWLMDFAAAAGRSGAVGGAGWAGSGEFWRANITQSDLRNVTAEESSVGVNGIDAHAHADLYAYTTDSAKVGFGSLYS